jgi:transcriptional regulator with XRE-family HTH domain
VGDVDEEYLEAERLAAELLRKARQGRGLTQVDVADEMADRGFHWSQPTVARVENRRRHLSLAEARALMDILELDEAVAYRRIDPT